MLRLFPFPPFVPPAIIGGSAIGSTVQALLRREWLSAGVSACVLLIAVAASRTMSEPTITFRVHVHRALRTAGILAGVLALLAAASFAIPSNRAANPITLI